MGAPISVRFVNDDREYPWRFYVERQDNPSRFYDYDDCTSWENALAAGLKAHREMVIEEDVTIDRDNQQDSVIYVGHWAPQALPFTGLAIFYSPDGVGRYYYNSVNAAREEHGDVPVRYVSRIED